MNNSTIVRFVKHYKVPVGIFLLTLVVGLYLAARILLDIVYFNDPRHQDQNLRNWMTPQYVMKSYDLPKTIVDEVFEIDPEVPQKRKIRFIAQRLDLSLEELTERLRLRANLYRESQ